MVVAKIAPSILASDFGKLAEEAQRMIDAGADTLHVDVMDGHFVPNISLGPPVVQSLRKHTKAFLDCHLMVSDPERWIADFAKAGADGITFHIEATKNARELIKTIRDTGMKVGVALKPATPAESVYEVASLVDMILVMTVEPGFGGQSFMEHCMPKVRTLRERYPEIDIQVDGGLGPDTIDSASSAGANVIVAGTSIFKAASPAAVIEILRKSVTDHIAA